MLMSALSWRLPRCVDRVVRNLDARTPVADAATLRNRRATILRARLSESPTNWPPIMAAGAVGMTLRTRPNGALRINRSSHLAGRRSLLLVIRGDAVFDSRLLQLLATRSHRSLVDSAVPSKTSTAGDSGPKRTHAKVCGAALLQRDWVSTRSGLSKRD